MKKYLVLAVSSVFILASNLSLAQTPHKIRTIVVPKCGNVSASTVNGHTLSLCLQSAYTDILYTVSCGAGDNTFEIEKGGSYQIADAQDCSDFTQGMSRGLTRITVDATTSQVISFE